MKKEFKVTVTSFEPEKISVGMLVVFNDMLLQVNGKEGNEYLIGTATVNVSQEPAFTPSGKRVFQPVQILDWQ